MKYDIVYNLLKKKNRNDIVFTFLILCLHFILFVQVVNGVSQISVVRTTVFRNIPTTGYFSNMNL